MQGAVDYNVVMWANTGFQWWIVTRGTETTFPRLPEGFDHSLIGLNGRYMVRARDLGDGTWYDVFIPDDGAIAFRASATIGGSASW